MFLKVYSDGRIQKTENNYKIPEHQWRINVIIFRGFAKITDNKKFPNLKLFLSYVIALFKKLHFQQFYFIKKTRLLIKEIPIYFKIKHFLNIYVFLLKFYNSFLY